MNLKLTEIRMRATRAGLLLLAGGAIAFATAHPAMNPQTDKGVERSAVAAVTPAETGRIVDIETTAGPIKVLLYDATPRHRDNFIRLASEGYYDGVLFHRVIKDFMIQTGDPDSRDAVPGRQYGSGDPGYTLEAEIDYPRFFHKKGALAAARTGDQVNPERRSSGSQFYIVTGNVYSSGQLNRMAEQADMSRRQDYFRQLQRKHSDEIKALYAAKDSAALETLRQQLIAETEAAVPSQGLPEAIRSAYTTVGGTPHLDGQYTVFGEVLEGLETVDSIQNVKTDRGDRPVEDVRIIRMIVEPESK